MKKAIYIIIFFLFSSVESESHKFDQELKNSVENLSRSKKNVARDKYRNPIETLSFFEIKKNKKVLEISPGSGYYSEIISHYMRNTNNYFVTEYKFPPVDAVKKGQKKFKKYFDLVLTFRNTHNWLGSNTAKNVYKSIYDSMKKGAILGIVQHKGNEDMEKNFNNGYVKESFLIDFIEEIGFQFVEKSNINANSKDTKDYKSGVWTLPPRLVMGEKDKKKYLAIGESDRMTLKFVK